MQERLAKWTNRKLRRVRILANVAVLLVGYAAPLCAVVGMCWSREGGSWRIPVTAMAVCVAIVMAMSRWLSSAVGKMGVSDPRSRLIKHSLEAACKCVLPVAIMAASAAFATWLKEEVDFYLKVVMVCLGCYIGGALIDRMAVGFLDDEYSLREKAREANAIDSRREIASGK